MLSQLATANVSQIVVVSDICGYGYDLSHTKVKMSLVV
jgi:hypothetical protein